MVLEHLYTELSSLDCSQEIWIAYSGGLDSHVLLHAAAQLRQQIPQLNLQAIHVHHGLSPQADHWVAHCQGVCAQLAAPLICEYLRDAPQPADSVEAWARESRYRVFAKVLPPNALLLTAHTQDDQAETVLLQLLRGAGPKGLAAMPQQQVFAAGRLCRPLLNFTRSQLHDYALQNNLIWIEDESNLDHRFARNFLRHQILPLLRQRWPAVASNLARSARHCAEAAENLTELAQLDLAHDMPQTLSLELLRRLSPARQRNVLRYWLQQQGCRLPNTQHIYQIQRDLINGRPDSRPQVHWGQWTLCRHHKALVLSSFIR